MSDLMNIAPAKANAGFGDKYFNDGDVVSCIIIEERLPSIYKEDIKELNAKRKTDAQLLGKPLTTVDWNKLFGIEYSVAIVRRRNKDAWEDTFGYDGDKIIEPKFSTYMQIRLSDFPHIYKLGKDMFPITRGINKLKCWINKNTNKLQFDWGDVIPNPWNCKDFKTGKNAHEIQEFEREEFQALLTKEEIRVGWVERLLQLWENKNNEQCLTILKEVISRTYLLCNIDDNKLIAELIPPQVGLLFQSRVINKSTKDGGFIVTLEPLKWDSSTKQLLYGSSMKVHIPTTDEIDFAKRILETRNENIRQKFIEKNTKPKSTDTHYEDQDLASAQQETIESGDDEW